MFVDYHLLLGEVSVKLHDHFSGLLYNVVNINSDRLQQLDEHVAALTQYLVGESRLPTPVQRFLPQGSWAHRTIIKPLPGQEFDADLLVQMKQQRTWSEDPQQYLIALHDALSKAARYRKRITLKTRCVRVSYAGECHVDLVPYIHENMYGWFDRHLIVNRKQNQFEEVNPAGFSQWMLDRDRVARRHLRTTLRLLKYVRDYQARFDVPSVILTVLVGGRVSRLLSMWDDRYRDLPTAFTALVRATDRWLQDRSETPLFEDPSCPTASFQHRIGDQGYARFRDQFHDYAERICSAYEETRRTGSIQLWREIFGEGFVSTR